jgi:hypothetical protein
MVTESGSNNQGSETVCISDEVAIILCNSVDPDLGRDNKNIIF